MRGVLRRGIDLQNNQGKAWQFQHRLGLSGQGKERIGKFRLGRAWIYKTTKAWVDGHGADGHGSVRRGLQNNRG